MNKKGELIVISGFSGVGKGTVVKKLIEKYHPKFFCMVMFICRMEDNTNDTINIWIHM